jgi:hypothetical protein
MRPRLRFIEPGTRYGRTVVVRELERENPRRIALKCDCGVEHVSFFGDVWRNQVTSCGCYRLEAIKRGLHATHGHFHRSEYAIWNSMVGRCHRPKDSNFHRYGARGIEVCERWRKSFENFFADMGPRPSPTHSVERRDNDGDYEPNNCRWATPKEQGRNRRNNRRHDYQGLSLTGPEWAERVGKPVVAGRLERGWTVERAITQPYDPRRTVPST